MLARVDCLSRPEDFCEILERLVEVLQHKRRLDHLLRNVYEFKRVAWIDCARAIMASENTQFASIHTSAWVSSLGSFAQLSVVGLSSEWTDVASDASSLSRPLSQLLNVQMQWARAACN